MAIQFNIRQDGRNVPEGLNVAEMALLNLSKQTWLIPNVTYTLHKFTNSGVLQIPRVTRGDVNATKGLCDLITSSTDNTFDFLTLLIDKYEYATLGSCFEGANLVTYEALSQLSKAELDKLKDAYQRSLLKTMVSSVTAATDGIAGETIVRDIKKMVNQYFMAHNKQPEIIVISDEAYELIEDNIIKAGGLDTVDYMLNGFAGKIGNVPVVVDPFLNNEAVVGAGNAYDVIVVGKEALHVAIATQINNIATPHGAVNLSQLGGQFISSVLFRHVAVRGVEQLTDVILPYGTAQDADYVIAAALVVVEP